MPRYLISLSYSIVASLLVIACGSGRPGVTPGGKGPSLSSDPTARTEPTKVAPIQTIPTSTSSAQGMGFPPPPSLPAAARLPTLIEPSAYTAQLSIDPAASGFSGEITITAHLPAPTQHVWLHAERLQITNVFYQRDATVIPAHATRTDDSRIAVSTAQPLQGAIKLTLQYTGSYETMDTVGAFKQVADGKPFVFSQLEATYARRVFPCFDEPSVKVPWTLTIDAPPGNEIIANEPERTRTKLANGWNRVHFLTSQPLPSYLLAFAVGDFAYLPAGTTRSGAPIRVVVRNGKQTEATFAAAASAKPVQILEDWFSLPYPYRKLDLVAVPFTLGFSAMENAGLITVNEQRILFDSAQPSQREQHRWIGLAAHEYAHQWFGNYVTLAWWDDIWLNEGFASWAENYVLDHYDTRWQDTLGATDDLATALHADSLSSARRVRQPIAAEGDIANAFDRITYQKGAALLGMLQAHLTAEVFAKGLHVYLRKFAWKNATSTDFIAALTQASGQDINAIIDGFLNQAGAPEVTATVECAATASPGRRAASIAVTKPRITFTQKRYARPTRTPAAAVSDANPAAPLWQFPICVRYGDAAAATATKPLAAGTRNATPSTASVAPAGTSALGAPTGQAPSTTRVECFMMPRAPKATFALQSATCPRWVYANAGGTGYYRVALDDASAAALLPQWQHFSAAERLTLISDVGANLLQQRISPAMLARALALVVDEPNRFALHAVGNWITELETFVPSAQQPAFDSWVRGIASAHALKAGWQPRPTDGLFDEAVRTALVQRVALAGDPALRKEAVRLAKDWHRVPSAIRAAILQVAAATDEAVYATLLMQLPQERERRHRTTIINALLATRKLNAFTSALPLLLRPDLDARELSPLLTEPNTFEQRAAAARYLETNFAAIMARLPSDSTTGSATGYAHVYANACDPAVSATTLRQTLQHRFAQMNGAAHDIAQALESHEQCVGLRRWLPPKITAWLRKRR